MLLFVRRPDPQKGYSNSRSRAGMAGRLHPVRKPLGSRLHPKSLVVSSAPQNVSEGIVTGEQRTPKEVSAVRDVAVGSQSEKPSRGGYLSLTYSPRLEGNMI